MIIIEVIGFLLLIWVIKSVATEIISAGNAPIQKQMQHQNYLQEQQLHLQAQHQYRMEQLAEIALEDEDDEPIAITQARWAKEHLERKAKEQLDKNS